MQKALLFLILIFPLYIFAQSKNEKIFTDTFDTKNCLFTTTGENTYFILKPGFQIVLQANEGKEKAELVITVLNETKIIGGVECRVVEEKESVNGQIAEISRNYFAFCQTTNTAFYFGEQVDIYKDGKVVSHDGAWVAEGNNKAGIHMPGLPLMGSRYYQEIAPGIAMDRAEIISVSEKFVTPAGTFENCLMTEEGNALKPKEKEFKRYAPGIGLIQDENLKLVKYGYIK